MATVGIVGGLGPESTIDYYRRILEAWQRDDATSMPSIVIDSLDVRRALRLVDTDRPALTEYLLESLRRLAGAGASFAAMTANTPHIVFDDLAVRSPLPLVSIVEVCAEEARKRGLRRLALLGTRFTMEGSFYQTVFARHGVAVVAPNETDRAWVHARYVEELLRGKFRDETRQRFISLVGRLRDEERIDGVILGGTELPLLLTEPAIAGLPVLDTTALHVASIVERLRHAGSRPADFRLTAFLATTLPARAAAFYGETLALRLVSDDPFALVFDANGVELRIQKVERLTPHPFTTLGWQVADVASTVTTLEARGVHFQRYPGLEQNAAGIWLAPSGAQIAWFQDPDGNLLSVAQYPLPNAT